MRDGGAILDKDWQLTTDNKLENQARLLNVTKASDLQQLVAAFTGLDDVVNLQNKNKLAQIL